MVGNTGNIAAWNSGYNTYYNITSSRKYFSDQGLESSSLTVDPEFTDAANLDFSINNSSVVGKGATIVNYGTQAWSNLGAVTEVPEAGGGDLTTTGGAYVFFN
jgi:hypothetical protein